LAAQREPRVAEFAVDAVGDEPRQRLRDKQHRDDLQGIEAEDE
jgi:hypothetical protein